MAMTENAAMTEKLEIMAPAGNFECLTAAIQAGADSVYFGVEKLNMRSHSANNFTMADLGEVCRQCREAGVKSYLTLNIALYQEDLQAMRDTLDAAKAAAVYAANEQLAPVDIYNTGERNKALPIVLIGTTAGTGSEVGRVSVLSNDETGRKKSIAPDDCNPSLTFADSTYTHSMPYAVTVSTALDALSHAIEGWFSSKCTDIPTMFAQKAIPMIWGGLKQLEKTREVPDAQMRKQLYYGSLYAGITLAYCGTAFPHPLGYVLTENYGVPHGMACAAFMPQLIDRAEKYEHEKLTKLLALTGETKESFNKTIISLTDTGKIEMTNEQLEEYCSRWENNTPNNFKFSPGGFSKTDAFLIMKEKFVR